MAFAGLGGNALAGWLLAGRRAVARLMAAAMLLFAGSLLVLPAVRTPAHAVGYGAALGLSGGIVTVVFFAGWGKLFGRRHVGDIQGAAQAVTVLASAAGPVALAAARAAAGSYDVAFHGMAAAAAAAGVLCLLVRPPRPARDPADRAPPDDAA
jgi:hypothetical protein